MIMRYILNLQSPLDIPPDTICKVVYCDRDRIILDRYDPDAPEPEQAPSIGVQVAETIRTADNLR